MDRRALGVGLAGFAAFLDLYSTQGMLPFLAREFDVSALQASATVSATTTAVALSAPFAGVLADRVGRKRVVVAAALLLAVPTLLASTSSSLNALVLWRAVQGLFLPAIFCTTVAYVGEECGDSVGRTMTSYVTGNILGGVLGRFIAASAAAELGWRAGFVLLGICNVLVAGLVWWLLPTSRHFVGERKLAVAFGQLLKHLRDARLWAGYAVGFNLLFSIVGTFTYVGFYLAGPAFGLGTLLIGAIFFVYLVAALVTPFTGRFIDRLGARAVLLAALALASSGVLMTLIPLLWVVIVGLAVCATGTFVAQSAANSYVVGTSGRARSSAAGLYVSLYYLGGTAGALLPGLAWHAGGWTACVALLVGVQCLTGGVAWLGWSSRHRSAPKRPAVA